MTKFHDIEIQSIDDTYLYLEIDRSNYRLRWKDASPLLAKATIAERQHIEIAPSGYGLHWPLIDEDLAVDPLREKMEKIESHLSLAR